MGASSAAGRKEYRELLEHYEVIQECRDEGLSYLESKATHQEYLLREMSCSDKESFESTRGLLGRREKQMEENKHLVSLKRVILSEEDQYCMTFYKIYALWEFPQRTLEDEINERILQKRRFQEK